MEAKEELLKVGISCWPSWDIMNKQSCSSFETVSCLSQISPEREGGSRVVAVASVPYHVLNRKRALSEFHLTRMHILKRTLSLRAGR